MSIFLPNIFLPFPLAAALVLLAGLLTNTMPAAGEAAPDVIRVACVGDSITQGVHVRSEIARCFERQCGDVPTHLIL